MDHARIVFLSLFLGLISGLQAVSLEVDPAVKSVRISLSGRLVATLTQPPWDAVIDFGPRIEPTELTAVGYDSHGDEIARATQIVNLPRPVAEIEIVVHNKQDGEQDGEKGNAQVRPAAAELRWQHRTFAHPQKAIIKVDSISQRVGKDFSASLPAVDWTRPHVISAEMDFDDGAVARRELVVGGESGFSDAIGTELTPVLVTQTTPHVPAKMEGCFSVDGQALRTGSVELTDPLVILVKDPDSMEGAAILGMKDAPRRYLDNVVVRGEAKLENGTIERILWPISRQFVHEGKPTTILFEPSNDIPAATGGLLWLLTKTFSPRPVMEPRSVADAVATAGVAAIERGRRRAVVLMLSSAEDRSLYAPETVRRYLARIGVPLFVWSATGPRPDLADRWGEIDDVSNVKRIRAATDRIRQTLAEQRIVWLAVDSLAALRVQPKESCGVVPVAKAREK